MACINDFSPLRCIRFVATTFMQLDFGCSCSLWNKVTTPTKLTLNVSNVAVLVTGLLPCGDVSYRAGSRMHEVMCVCGRVTFQYKSSDGMIVGF